MRRKSRGFEMAIFCILLVILSIFTSPLIALNCPPGSENCESADMNGVESENGCIEEAGTGREVPAGGFLKVLTSPAAQSLAAVHGSDHSPPHSPPLNIDREDNTLPLTHDEMTTTLSAKAARAGLTLTTPLGPLKKVSVAPLKSPKYKQLARVIVPINTSDGAGVSLMRSIGGPKAPELDPFLLLDEFKSDDPKDYEAGFPEHPHRGFETVTIMLQGNFKHQDNKGNTGFLTSGGVQWMTAGRGVQHSETPMQADGLMWGFQLWVNLPAAQKMIEPRYQDIDADKIPTVELDNGVSYRLIAGSINDGEVVGPVAGVFINPTLLDVTVPAGQSFEYPIPEGHTLFLYTVEGKLQITDSVSAEPRRLIVYTHEGDSVKVSTPEDSAARFLVVSGSPINEPIARHGPFVMNTREEIRQCFTDLYTGRF